MTIKISKQINSTTVLMFMMFLYSGIGNYVWRALVSIIPISFSSFTSIVWSVVVVWSLPFFCRRIRAKHIVLYLIVALFFFAQWIFSDQSVFKIEKLGTLVFFTLAAFFVGVSVEIDDKLFDPLYKSSILVLIVSIAYSFYYMTDRTMLTDNMGFAYNVLPAILIIASGMYIKEKRKVSIIFTVIAFVFLLALGTRGPILCFVIFLILMMVKKLGFSKFSVIAVAVGIIFNVFINSTLYTSTMINFSNTLSNMGFSTRIVEMILEDNVSDANGRDAIQDKLIGEIREEPFEFRGVFSDRISTRGLVDREHYISYTNGTYAHNLFIEILHSYGVAIGGILLISLLLFMLNFFLHSKLEVGYIVVLVICMGFVQLIMSGTYLTQPTFFMMMGLFMNDTVFPKELEKRRGFDDVETPF